MPRIVHARIDAETEKVLVELERKLGWSTSKVVREGIKALNGLLLHGRPRCIAGQGEFASGVTDLGACEHQLNGFGIDSTE